MTSREAGRRGRVLIAGLGDVGSAALHDLARAPTVGAILALEVDGTRARQVASARYCAQQGGRFPQLDFLREDIRDVRRVAEILQAFHPDVVLNATTLLSWWVIKTLPEALGARLAAARFGPWLPVHLTLTWKLMQAVRAARIAAVVVNASYPDVVNPVLGRVGLAPTVGIGNVDLLAPAIREAAADLLGLPSHHLRCVLVAHHAHVFPLFGEGRMLAPYFLRVSDGERDLTRRLPPGRLFRRVAELHAIPTDRSLARVTAASAAKTVLALLDDTDELTHAAGPLGLPGGYPVRLGAAGPRLALPRGLTRARAVRLNERAMAHDGIAGIGPEGTVRFLPRSVAVMRKVLGYHCPELRLRDSERRAAELVARVERLR